MGLKPGVRQFRACARPSSRNRAEELLNWINIYPGEMIYVAGGTVHTLGPGSIMVETQQQSDCTYRLYDYGRPRELHLKEGLAAVKEKVASGKVLRPAPARIGQTKNTMAADDPRAVLCGGSVRTERAASFRNRRRDRKEVGSDSGCDRGVRRGRGSRNGACDFGKG